MNRLICLRSTGNGVTICARSSSLIDFDYRKRSDCRNCPTAYLYQVLLPDAHMDFPVDA